MRLNRLGDSVSCVERRRSEAVLSTRRFHWLEGGGDQETNTNFLRKKIVSDQFVLPCNVMRQKYRGTKDEIQITCL